MTLAFCIPLSYTLSLLLYLQALPEMPRVLFDDFGPGVREQVRQAYNNVKAKPRDAEANGRLGMMLHTYEQYEPAVICYLRARHFAPGEFRWAYYAGIVQSALGNHGEAIAAFKESITRRPDYLPAHLRLADAFFADGQLSASQQSYETVAKKDASIAQALYGLGRIKVARGEFADAIVHFRKALDLFPDYTAAHYAIGLALRDLGQTAKAQEHLALSQKQKSLRPPLADPLLIALAELNAGASEHLKRGVIFESLGKIEEAITAHERALEINPNYVQAHINLISLYGRLGQIENAEKHYRAAVAINAELADSHYNYGVLLVGQQKYQEAAQAFHRSLQINPFHADYHHNYAVMLERAGRLSEAAAHYRKALENQPGHRLAHFHLGRILVHQDKLAEAIEHFLLTLTPEDAETPRFTYALGATYVRAGEKSKGIHYLREALKQAAALRQTQLVTSIERDLRILQ